MPASPTLLSAPALPRGATSRAWEDGKEASPLRSSKLCARSARTDQGCTMAGLELLTHRAPPTETNPPLRRSRRPLDDSRREFEDAEAVPSPLDFTASPSGELHSPSSSSS